MGDSQDKKSQRGKKKGINDGLTKPVTTLGSERFPKSKTICYGGSSGTSTGDNYYVKKADQTKWIHTDLT